MVSTYDSRGRWRELREPNVSTLQTAAQGSVARPQPDGRRSEQVRDASSAAKPLGVVWVVTTYPLVLAGLEKTLEGKADVRAGGSAPDDGLSCIVLYADSTDSGFVGDLKRLRARSPGVPLLVFGARLNLELAKTALENGADGFIHAAMDRGQVVRAVEVVQQGELVAPRQLLKYILTHGKTADVRDLSPRQTEILGLVAENLSNAEIAERLYLSESTVKQHLGAAYKLLGVRNRTEAAKMVMDQGRDF